MKLCALLIAAALAAPDGGTATFQDADAGVYRVEQAQTSDGGTLGPGWYMTPERMTKVGVRLVALENENQQLKVEVREQVKLTWGFWVGMGVGAVAGVGTTILIVKAVR